MRPATQPTFAAALAATLAIFALTAVGGDEAPGADAASEDAVPGAGSPPVTDAAAPFEEARLRHGYLQQDDGTLTFLVPGGAGPLDFDAWVEPSGGLCSGPWTWRLEVTTPSEETFATLQEGGTNVGISVVQGACASAYEHGSPMEAGAWTVRFSGSGPFVGRVEVALLQGGTRAAEWVFPRQDSLPNVRPVWNP